MNRMEALARLELLIRILECQYTNTEVREATQTAILELIEGVNK